MSTYKMSYSKLCELALFNNITLNSRRNGYCQMKTKKILISELNALSEINHKHIDDAFVEIDDLSEEEYYLILDCETDAIGSFRPPRQKLLQLGFILLDSSFNVILKYEEYNREIKKVGSFHDVSILKKSSRGKALSAVLNDLETILDKYSPTIVAHNAEFDVGVIGKAGLRIRLPVLCTMKIAAKYNHKNGGSDRYPSLVLLSEQMNIPIDQQHTALNDCECLMKVFVHGRSLAMW